MQQTIQQQFTFKIQRLDDPVLVQAEKDYAKADKQLHIISHAHSSLYSPILLKIKNHPNEITVLDRDQLSQANAQLQSIISKTTIPLNESNASILLHNMSFELLTQFGKDLRDGLILTKNNKSYLLQFTPNDDIRNALLFIRYAKMLGISDQEIYKFIYGFSQGGIKGDLCSFALHQHPIGMDNPTIVTTPTPLVISLNDKGKASSISVGLHLSTLINNEPTLIGTYEISHTWDQTNEEIKPVTFSDGYTAPGALQGDDLNFDLSISYQAYREEGVGKLPAETSHLSDVYPPLPLIENKPEPRQHAGWMIFGIIIFAALLVTAAIWLWPIILGTIEITLLAATVFGAICGIAAILPTLIEQRGFFSFKSYAGFFILSTLIFGAAILLWPATLTVAAILILTGVSLALSAIFNYFMRSWRKAPAIAPLQAIAPMPPVAPPKLNVPQIFAASATFKPKVSYPGIEADQKLKGNEKIPEPDQKPQSQLNHPIINLIREEIAVELLKMILILNLNKDKAPTKTEQIINSLNNVIEYLDMIKEQNTTIQAAFSQLKELYTAYEAKMPNEVPATLSDNIYTFAKTYFTELEINIYGNNNYLMQMAADSVNHDSNLNELALAKVIIAQVIQSAKVSETISTHGTETHNIDSTVETLSVLNAAAEPARTSSGGSSIAPVTINPEQPTMTQGWMNTGSAPVTSGATANSYLPGEGKEPLQPLATTVTGTPITPSLTPSPVTVTSPVASPDLRPNTSAPTTAPDASIIKPLPPPTSNKSKSTPIQDEDDSKGESEKTGHNLDNI